MNEFSTRLNYRGGLYSTGLLIVLMSLPCLPACTQENAATQPIATPAKPRLILQITVDALRGDLPRRYSHMLGDGGFRYLMEQGIDYTNAHYQHANTETFPGMYRWQPARSRLRMECSGMYGLIASWDASSITSKMHAIDC